MRAGIIVVTLQSMGLTGIDSKCDWCVSMPSVVDMARETQSSNCLNGDNNYALAA